MKTFSRICNYVYLKCILASNSTVYIEHLCVNNKSVFSLLMSKVYNLNKATQLLCDICNNVICYAPCIIVYKCIAYYNAARYLFDFGRYILQQFVYYIRIQKMSYGNKKMLNIPWILLCQRNLTEVPLRNTYLFLTKNMLTKHEIIQRNSKLPLKLKS